jgi:hypothetical protein
MWEILGILSLGDDWLTFPRFSNATVFRFTCLGWSGIPPSVRGFAWVRLHYLGLPGGSGVTRSIRVYPKPEPEIIEIPRPPDFESGGYYSRWPAAKKGKPRYYAQQQDWSLQVEGYLP